MEVRVKLLADDIWGAEEDKKVSLVLKWIFLIGYI